MKPFIRLFLTFSFFFLANAVQAQKASFDQWGIAFDFPKDWKVTDQEDFGGNNYYLAVEKNGNDASGLFMITITPNKIDLEEHIKSFQENISASIPGAKTGAVKSGSFGSYTGAMSDYTFSLLGIDHQAVMYCFYVNDKTVLVVTQEANEDHNENEQGFEQIEKSLRIK